MTYNAPSVSPDISPEVIAFQAAANGSRLLFGYCAACATPHYYPRRVCPFCWSDMVEWRQASGRGQIYSFSIVRKAEPPYAPAYVALVEGATLLTNIIDSDFDGLKIGDDVELVFMPDPSGQMVPFFRIVA